MIIRYAFTNLKKQILKYTITYLYILFIQINQNTIKDITNSKDSNQMFFGADLASHVAQSNDKEV